MRAVEKAESGGFCEVAQHDRGGWPRRATSLKPDRTEPRDATRLWGLCAAAAFSRPGAPSTISSSGTAMPRASRSSSYARCPSRSNCGAATANRATAPQDIQTVNLKSTRLELVECSRSPASGGHAMGGIPSGGISRAWARPVSFSATVPSTSLSPSSPGGTGRRLGAQVVTHVHRPQNGIA
jgi:hypothetical protein